MLGDPPQQVYLTQLIIGVAQFVRRDPRGT
jgi:hypothetical protein